MGEKELINRLREALRQKKIDTQHVRQLVRQIEARETLNHWLSVGVTLMLAAGVGVGLVFSLKGVVVGA